MDLVGSALGANWPPKPAPGMRTAFVIGNVGKLGDELLNVLLENPAYERVVVAVEKPMQVTLARLETIAWNPAAKLAGAVDDLYLCLEPRHLSYWKTTKPFVEIASEQALAVARAARAAGATRAMVLTPLEALEQMGGAPLIRSGDEIELVAAGFERLVLLRPTRDGQDAAAGNLGERVGAGVVRALTSYMTPKGLQPVRVRRAAQVAMESLAQLEDGVHVIGAQRLRELTGDPLS
jgi:hypothetical protein